MDLTAEQQQKILDKLDSISDGLDNIIKVKHLIVKSMDKTLEGETDETNRDNSIDEDGKPAEGSRDSDQLSRLTADQRP